MATRQTLHAQPRALTGKKVRRLRTEGILPATVYGHRVTPQNIQVDHREFRDVLKHAGTTQLIDLVVDGGAARPVLVRQMERNAKRNDIIHVEFFQANLHEKVTTHVPLHTSGNAPAVDEGGILLTILDHVDVESFPQDVPPGLEVDITKLSDFNSAVHAGEIILPAAVTLVTPPDEVVVKVNPPAAADAVEEAIEATEPLPSELGGDEEQPDAVPES